MADRNHIENVNNRLENDGRETPPNVQPEILAYQGNVEDNNNANASPDGSLDEPLAENDGDVNDGPSVNRNPEQDRSPREGDVPPDNAQGAPSSSSESMDEAQPAYVFPPLLNNVRVTPGPIIEIEVDPNAVIELFIINPNAPDGAPDQIVHQNSGIIIDPNQLIILEGPAALNAGEYIAEDIQEPNPNIEIHPSDMFNHPLPEDQPRLWANVFNNAIEMLPSVDNNANDNGNDINYDADIANLAAFVNPEEFDEVPIQIPNFDINPEDHPHNNPGSPNISSNQPEANLRDSGINRNADVNSQLNRNVFNHPDEVQPLEISQGSQGQVILENQMLNDPDGVPNYIVGEVEVISEGENCAKDFCNEYEFITRHLLNTQRQPPLQIFQIPEVRDEPRELPDVHPDQFIQPQEEQQAIPPGYLSPQPSFQENIEQLICSKDRLPQPQPQENIVQFVYQGDQSPQLQLHENKKQVGSQNDRSPQPQPQENIERENQPPQPPPQDNVEHLVYQGNRSPQPEPQPQHQDQPLAAQPQHPVVEEDEGDGIAQDIEQVPENAQDEEDLDEGAPDDGLDEEGEHDFERGPEGAVVQQEAHEGAISFSSTSNSTSSNNESHNDDDEKEDDDNLSDTDREDDGGRYQAMRHKPSTSSPTKTVTQRYLIDGLIRKVLPNLE